MSNLNLKINCKCELFPEAILPEGLEELFLNTMKTGLENVKVKESGIPLSHPIHISELFSPNSVKPTRIDLNYTVSGLAKLLVFNAYANAQTENVSEYVNLEARKYPYTLKSHSKQVLSLLHVNNSFIKHSFSQETHVEKFELGKYPSKFHIAVTDAGLCQVLNGDTMRSTFKPTNRMKELWAALDSRSAIKPNAIMGSGKIYQETLWIDIGER